MKRAFFTRNFHTNTPVLIQMFALRASGIALNELAQMYNRDRQTLRLQLVKHHITPLNEVTKRHWGKMPRTAILVRAEAVPVAVGKYDYLIDELWENRSLGA